MKLGIRKRRPYVYLELKLHHDRYMQLNIEFPRLHFLLELDWDTIWSYIDYHGLRNYRMWSVGLAWLAIAFRFDWQNKAIHYNDWR